MGTKVAIGVKQKHGKIYVSKAERSRRKRAKRELAKYSRACEKLLIAQEQEEYEEWASNEASKLVALAAEVRWGLQDIIEMYNAYGVVDPRVQYLAVTDYDTFMQDIELYH